MKTVCTDDVEKTPPKENDNKIPTRRWRQYFAATIANIMSLCSGMAMGWTSPALPVLQGHAQPGATPLRLSLEEGSWTSALCPLGAIAGAMVAGAAADRAGRKGALLAFAAPVLAGWLFVTFAGQSLLLLYAGRLLMGLSLGSNTVLVPLYSEEISETAIRGAIGALLDAMISLGIFLAYVLGALLPYFWLCLAPASLPVLLVACFAWLPESPVHLAARGRLDAARKALRWFRAQEADVEPELQVILAELKASREANGGRSAFGAIGALCSRSALTSPAAKALGICVGVLFFSQMTGVNVFIYYTEDVFREAGSALSGALCSIVVSAVAMAGTFLSVVIVDRLGRRRILITSSFVTGVCLAALSLHTHFAGPDAAAWQWLPLTALVIYMIMASVGYGPIQWFMMAELLPVEAKGWGSCVCVVVFRVFAVVVTKEFPVLAASLGQDITYAIFCVLTFVGTAFVAAFVIETKGKAREEIQRRLRGGKSSRTDVAVIEEPTQHP